MLITNTRNVSFGVLKAVKLRILFFWDIVLHQWVIRSDISAHGVVSKCQELITH
jgi:hypothetical protein